MKGMTVKEISNLLGVPLTTYREWELGRKISNQDIYVKLSKILEIPLYELMTGVSIDKKELVDCIYQVEIKLNELKERLFVLLS